MKSESRKLKADLALVLVAVVWGSAFVAQRQAMEQVGPFAFGAARFALGGLTLLPIIGWRQWRGPTQATTPAWRAGLVLGALLFAGSAFQQVGLVYTTAGKGGFITGLYIVIVPLLLALVWRERIPWNCWLGAGLAVVGLFLLSMKGVPWGERSELQLAAGDGWVVISAWMWAVHVIAIGRLAPGRDPLRLALIQYGVCALLSAGVALALEWGKWGNVLAAWPAVLYTGVISIGLGYTVQVAAQRYTPPTHTALILSMESVFAALAGWLILGETMSPRMIAGAIVMLAGILAAQTLGNARAARSTVT